MKKKYTVGSLFAGIGGICSAFEKAGCEILWANEWDEKACLTYEHNFRTKLLEGDIAEITDPLKLGKVDIIVSGFPCQAFSVAGYRQGFEDEKGRGNLFFETARFIESIRPKAFMLENVRNLVSHDKGKTFDIIRKTIVEDLNYSFIPFLLNSKNYGNIPQTRDRIYVVGFKGESDFVFNLNEEPSQDLFNANIDVTNTYTHNFKIPSKIKLKKHIQDLIDSKKHDSKYYYNKDHHYYPKLTPVIRKKDTVYQWRRMYVRENKSNLCPTLTANMGTGGHNVPLILDDFGIRKLTPKECLNFQGFPKNFNFPEFMPDSQCYKQAGNSVVVPVVERIAKEILNALDLKINPINN